MGTVKKIRGSIPGAALPLAQDRELIQDGNTGAVYIGFNGSNQLVSNNAALQAQITVLDAAKVSTTDVTATAAANKIARRDANGLLPGNLDGEADRAKRLSTARKISISGGAIGETTFDGSADKEIVITVDPDAHEHALTDLADFPDLSLSEGKILRVGPGGSIVPDEESLPDNVYTTAEIDNMLAQKAAETHSHEEYVTALQLAYEVNSATDAKFSDATEEIDASVEQAAIYAELAQVAAAHAASDAQQVISEKVSEAAQSAIDADVSADAAAQSALDATENGEVQVNLAAQQVEIATEQVALAAAQVQLAIGQVSLAANEVSLATAQKDLAVAQAALATAQANLAGSYASTVMTAGMPIVGHDHRSGYIAECEAVFARLSETYDSVGTRFEYNKPRYSTTNGWLVEEGTTNLLPSGSENFVTGWTNGTGETCTITPNQPDPWGGYTAYRIQGDGEGSSASKYYANISGQANPHTHNVSAWCKLLSGTATMCNVSSGDAATITGDWTRLNVTRVINASSTQLLFYVASASAVLDILVCCPQIENKSYMTSYVPPQVTRAAESLTIPVNAVQRNLLTANQSNVETDTTGFTAQLGATLTRDTSEYCLGTSSLKVVTPNAANSEGVNMAITTDAYSLSVLAALKSKIACFSCYLKGSGTVKIALYSYDGNWRTATSASITLTSTWTRYQISDAILASASVIKPLIQTDGQQAATFYVDCLQLEESTTASDWTLGGVVDYSQAVLNPTQGTVEIDFVPSSSLLTYVAGIYPPILVIAQGTYRLAVFAYNNLFYLSASNENGTTEGTVAANTVLTVDTKARIAFKWSSSVMTCWVNGVKKITVNTPKLPTAPNTIYLGCNYSTPKANSYYSNIRLSSIARSDAELAYTGTLTPDQYTTFFRDFTKSPDYAGTRPAMVNSDGTRSNLLSANDHTNFKNALVNGDMRLATRGTTVTPAASLGYCLDNWFVRYDGTIGTYAVSQVAMTAGQQEVPGAEYYLRWAHTAAGSGSTYRQLRHKIENVYRFNGKKTAFQLYARSNVAATILPSIQAIQNFGTGGSPSADVATTLFTNLSVGTVWQKVGQVFTMPSIAGKTLGSGLNDGVILSIGLPINATFQLDFALVELKESNFDSVYDRRPLAVERLLARRTLQTIPANYQLRAVNVQANTIDFVTDLPITMRAAPTLVAGLNTETTNWKVLVNGTQTTGFALALLNAGTNQVGFRLTKTSHGLTDATLLFVTDILLSAEL
jgi:hypothetical protein